MFRSLTWSLLVVVVVLFLMAARASAADAFAAPVFQPAPKFAAPKCDDCGPSCPCPAGACPVACGTEPVQYVQVCENGKCRLVPIKAAPSAPGSAGVQPASYAGPRFPLTAAPCASGSCGTLGTGSVPLAAAYSSCSSGSCGTRSGWYPGKLLGRRR